jgi:raffinose/stachyose/melibiose transport system permease protein
MSSLVTEPVAAPQRPGAARPAGRRRRLRAFARSRSAASLLLALVWGVIVAAPIYYVICVSLEPDSGFLTSNPWFPSGGVTFVNYRTVWNSGFLRYLINSLIVSGGATVLALVVSLLCAYAIVVRVNRATGFIFRVFLTGFAVPIQALMIPLYVEILSLHIYDTLLGLILPLAAFSLPITVLVLVNFLRDVPRSLIDAMSLDGAGPLRILRSLAVPISLPAIMTVGIFDFITAWNNFLFPLILTQSGSSATLPLAVFNFQGNHFGNVPQIMACVVLSAVPLLALYLVARKQIISGLAAGFGS